jgi:hypothetical protein
MQNPSFDKPGLNQELSNFLAQDYWRLWYPPHSLFELCFFSSWGF